MVSNSIAANSQIYTTTITPKTVKTESTIAVTALFYSSTKAASRVAVGSKATTQALRRNPPGNF